MYIMLHEYITLIVHLKRIYIVSSIWQCRRLQSVSKCSMWTRRMETDLQDFLHSPIGKHLFVAVDAAGFISQSGPWLMLLHVLFVTWFTYEDNALFQWVRSWECCIVEITYLEFDIFIFVMEYGFYDGCYERLFQ